MNKKQTLIPYEKIEGEIWKKIELCKGYEISNLGRVKIGEYIISPNSRYGYCVVRLNKTGKKIKSSFLVHRLVAEAFIPNKKLKPEVDHIDTDKTNNNVNNLRWCWHLENMIGNKNTLSKLNEGYKKRVIYESIRQDLYYSMKNDSKISYDDGLEDIVFNSVGKSISELLSTLRPSCFGTKTVKKLHQDDSNNINSSLSSDSTSDNLSLCTINLSYFDIHPGMRVVIGEKQGKIIAIDLDTKKIKIDLSDDIIYLSLSDVKIHPKILKA